MATWYWGWGYDDWSGASASSGGGLPHRPSKDSLRPVTEFATVLAAIDAKHQGGHVHVTDAKQLSINCFPTGFASHGGQLWDPLLDPQECFVFGCSARSAEHAGLYMEKICESLTAVYHEGLLSDRKWELQSTGAGVGGGSGVPSRPTSC